MLTDDVQIISVDDHVIEHPRVWLDRLPSKYQDDAPRIERGEDGNDYWIFEGKKAGNFAINAVAGKDRKDFGMDPRTYDDMRSGCHDIHDRIADMDTEGVWAQMNFPNMPGFAGRVFAAADDPQLGLACVKAYNDWIIDEWCAAYPERQIPLVILPYWDIEETVKEIHRTADKGAKSVAFVELPHRVDLPSWHTDHWNPMLQAVTDRNLPVSIHFGSGGFPPGVSTEGVTTNFTIGISLFALNSANATAELLLSPVFHKFPDLKFVLSEGGIGWVPYMLERIDYVWDRHKWYNDVNREVRPSELWHRNMFAPFIADDAGIYSRHLIGIDNIMFESDYPHSDSNWPHTRTMLRESLAEVPSDECRKIAEDNARRVYNFPRVS